MTTDSHRLFLRAAVEHAFARTPAHEAFSLTSFWTDGGFKLVLLSLIVSIALAGAVQVDVAPAASANVERCSVLHVLFRPVAP